jgi:nitroreductase
MSQHEDASLAPSSFNLQHCRFMAITTPELKSELANTTLPANRQRVMDALLRLSFAGDILAHTDLAQRLDECVAADTLTREVADEWFAFVSNVYSRSIELIRDAIMRSCSLAAMVFMLSATNKGLDTCPIGFNAGGLITALRLPERYIPVMLLALDTSTQRPITRRPRRAVPDLLTFNESPQLSRSQMGMRPAHSCGVELRKIAPGRRHYERNSKHSHG